MFSKRLLIGAGWLLLGTWIPLKAQSTTGLLPTALAAASPDADLGSARYTAARDSALAKAAAYRAQIEERLKSFNASFTGIAGLRYKVKSYNLAGPVGAGIMLKKHIVKHKTTGARIDKIDYYALSGKLLLSERYVQGQLVRLEAIEYLSSDALLRGKTVSGTWLLISGDYLRRTRSQFGKDKSTVFYFRTQSTNLK